MFLVNLISFIILFEICEMTFTGVFLSAKSVVSESLALHYSFLGMLRVISGFVQICLLVHGFLVYHGL